MPAAQSQGDRCNQHRNPGVVRMLIAVFWFKTPKHASSLSCFRSTHSMSTKAYVRPKDVVDMIESFRPSLRQVLRYLILPHSVPHFYGYRSIDKCSPQFSCCVLQQRQLRHEISMVHACNRRLNGESSNANTRAALLLIDWYCDTHQTGYKFFPIEREAVRSYLRQLLHQHASIDDSIFRQPSESCCVQEKIAFSGLHRSQKQFAACRAISRYL